MICEKREEPKNLKKDYKTGMNQIKTKQKSKCEASKTNHTELLQLYNISVSGIL